MFLHLLLAFLAITPTLRLPGHFYMAYEIKITAYVTVPVDRDNREVGIQWEGDEGGGYTSRQLDEYVDWTQHSFRFILRPGTYQIRAVLKRAPDKIVYSGAQTVVVTSDRPSDGE